MHVEPGFTLLLTAAVACLVAVASAITWLLRHRSASLRHAVWLACTLCIVALSIGALLPSVRVPVLPALASVSRPARVVAPTLDARESTQATIIPTAPQGSEAPRDFTAWLFAAWLVGLTWLAARLIAEAAGAHTIVRQGKRLDDAEEWSAVLREAARRVGVQPAPRAVLSRLASTAFVCGIVRPVIVLPAHSRRWSREQRLAVLLHELAHVKRRDLLAQAFAHAATLVQWYNPAAWLAAHRLRCESERACDDLVIQSGVRPSDYAQQLMDMVLRMHPLGRRAPAAALAMARHREVESRLVAIVAGGTVRTRMSEAARWGWPVGVALLGAAAVVIRPVHASAALRKHLGLAAVRPAAIATTGPRPGTRLQGREVRRETLPGYSSAAPQALPSSEERQIELGAPPDVQLTAAEQPSLVLAPVTASRVGMLALVAQPEQTSVAYTDDVSDGLTQVGFYTRQRSARTHRAQFIAIGTDGVKTPSTVSSLFANVLGMHVERAGMLVGANGCAVITYLDGAPLNRVQGKIVLPVALDELVNPNELAGIEAYEDGAAAPPQYQSPFGGPSCPVALLWTRR